MAPRPTWRNYHRGLMAEAASDVPSSTLKSVKPAMSKTKGRNGRGVGRFRRERKRHSRQAKLFDISPNPKCVAPVVQPGRDAAADLLGFVQGQRFATIL